MFDKEIRKEGADNRDHQILLNQLSDARKASSGTVFCCNCDRAVPLWKVYRCLYCGFYFCRKHARIHFAD